MLLLAAWPAGAAQPVLTAVSAPGLDPDGAWSDRRGWAGVPPAMLRGVDGTVAEPAEVRARWNGSVLFVEFLCRDESVVSPGTRDGLDHFKLGDVVEVFLGRRGQPGYVEVHATPAGRKTVYAFCAYRRAAPPVAGSEVRAGPVDGGWRAVLSIPWPSPGGSPGEEGWEILAGRYDYAEPGGTPVLSSFPGQTGRPDFHARGRYARLELQP
ncbi:MAG: hypothetical protein WEB31_00195 [Chthoniobacterales bacterium]